MKKLILAASVAALLAGCASVRPEDQAAWVGAPVSELDTHPIFFTMRPVRAVTDDGTEIRNYVNGGNIGSCSGGGSIYAGTLNMASYQQFSSCMSRFAACNNIFYIKNGKVTNYVPIGTGGARCYTDERTRPGYRGSTNIF